MKKLTAQIRHLIIRILVPALLSAIFSAFPRRQKTLLLIKNDGIGDYILFRNFIQFLKTSGAYKDYRIYLLVNPAFKELASALDGHDVESLFVYADHYFIRWELTRLLFRLQRLRFDTVIYPNYSRKKSVDWLINQLCATHKIGVDGDDVNQTDAQKQKSANYYTKLLTITNPRLHEFDLNKKIMEACTGVPCSLGAPFIDPTVLPVNLHHKIVIFPGGSVPEKKWPAENYKQLVRHILMTSKMKLVIAGGPEDKKDDLIITAGLPEGAVESTTGQLNLTRLCELIGGAALLISNDTAAVHIAAMFRVPVVCISKGDRYGRFVPYPLHLHQALLNVKPREADKRADYYHLSPFAIESVQLPDVIAAVTTLLNHQNN